MKPALLLILVPLMGACDVSAKRPQEGDDNVTIRADEGGQVSFNMPFASGEVKLPQSALENSKFDIDGVQMMPGGRTTSFNLDSSDGEAIVKLGFAAPQSADAVRTYFLDEFGKKGVEASASGNRVSGQSKDGDSFVIDIRPAPDGSTGTITIDSKN